MKSVYSRRALADLEKIANYYSANASPAIATSIERRFREVIDRICRLPDAAPRVSQRSHVRVVLSSAIHSGSSIGFVERRSIFFISDTRLASPSRDVYFLGRASQFGQPHHFPTFFASRSAEANSSPRPRIEEKHYPVPLCA
jgi:plasmid stabilization system protein ParE